MIGERSNTCCGERRKIMSFVLGVEQSKDQRFESDLCGGCRQVNRCRWRGPDELLLILAEEIETPKFGQVAIRL